MNKKLEEARLKYKKGTIVQLTAPISDPYSPKTAGSKFRVDYIDDGNNIHGSWLPPASGSLCLILGVDNFVIVEEES